MIVMENNKLRIYTLDGAKDKHLGKFGTEKRDKYEYELRLAKVNFNVELMDGEFKIA